MPRLSSAVLLPMLALALALPGCGSDSSAVQEVPGAPAGLTVPHQKGAGDLSEGAAGATPTPTPSAGATPAPAGSGTTGSTGTTGTTGTSGTTGAAATPAPATQDSPASDQAPASGSAPEKFEQFCEENAGAC